MNHNEVVNLILEEHSKGDKKRYTDLFLHSLGGIKQNPSLRAYGILKTFPQHDFINMELAWCKWGNNKFVLTTKILESNITKNWKNENIFPTSDSNCSICSDHYKPYEKDDDEDIMDSGYCRSSIYCLYDIITITNKLSKHQKPVEKDFQIFKSILEVILDASPEEKILDIVKKLKKCEFYKDWIKEEKAYRKQMGTEQRYFIELNLQTALEVLGIIGLLHTEEHKGAFYEYVNISNYPRPSHSSDWHYPVNFWRGKYGVDWDAFDYWFSEYEELTIIKEEFRKK